MTARLSVLALALTSFSYAQEPPPATPANPPVPAPEAPKTIEDAIKGMEKLDGFLTLYRKQAEGQETVYAEVPADRFGKLMLLQATAGMGLQGTPSGDVFPGLPLGDLALRLEGDGDKVKVIQPVLSVRGTTPEAKRLIARSYPNSILTTLPVVAKSADEKTWLVDLSAFLKSDPAGFAAQLDPSGQGAGPMVQSDGSEIQTLKNLPENASYTVAYNLMWRGPSPRTVQFPVAYSWSFLPDSDYRPRLGDPRVGYFTTDFVSLDDAASQSPRVNYILRWNLKKKEPGAAFSEPVKPIVFWVDNATPAEYRDAVRDGILTWNKAFARMGYKDAVQVKQMPDDADWDVSDVRYNVVRWTSGFPFAIALFRNNPVTGEIVNAAINMDAVFARGGVSDFDLNFQGQSPVQIRERFFPKMGRDAKRGAAKAHLHADGRTCDLAHLGAAKAEFALSAGETLFPGTMDRKEFVRQYIVEVVAHEMGHILGLRHNFAASTELDGKELAEGGKVKQEGIGASVMDYNAANLFAIGRKGVDVYSQTVGKYDLWAIEYGYKDVAAPTPEAERPALNAVARRSGEPGLRYESDNSVNGEDPSVYVFDLAKDPNDFYEQQLRLSRRLMKSLVENGVRPGDSYYGFTRKFNRTVSEYLGAALYLPGVIGGVQLGNSYKGDVGGKLPSQPYEPAKQRRAFSLLRQYVLAPGAIPVTPKALAQITFDPDASGNEASGRAPDLLDTVILVPQITVSLLLSPPTLRAVANNEFRTAKVADRVTTGEIVRGVTNDVFAELTTKKPTDLMRRGLQQETVTSLIFLSQSSVPSLGDARAEARTQLKRIRGLIGRGGYAQAEASHYADLVATIDRYFRAVNVVR